MSNNPFYKSIKELRNIYEKKEASVSEISKAFIQRIKYLNPKINAYLEVFEKESNSDAKKADSYLNNGNKDILTGIIIGLKDLVDVKGKITSDKRDTIYIVSDFAQYNSVNLNSKFYKNVIINYQDKKISCVNFDINMSTNKAIAYNDVIITDPKSTMKAGIVEFDLKTKDININPESINTKIEVISN